MANNSPKVLFEMPFLTLSGADVNFLGRELWWRSYTTKKTLPTTRHVELVSKKKFAAAVLDSEYETYVIHVGSVSSDLLSSSSPLDVHPSRRSQVSGLIAENTPTKVPAEYFDFADIFSLNLTSELFKYIRINDHAIKLVDD